MSDLTLTWHGTASIELSTGQTKLLFDPFIPYSGSSYTIPLSTYDHADAIYVTHGHLDHILSIPAIIQRNPTVNVYCTKTPYKTLHKMGVSKDNLVCIDYPKTYHCYGFTINTYHGAHAKLPINMDQLKRIISEQHKLNLPSLLVHHIQCSEHGESVFYTIECRGLTIALMGSLNLNDDIDYPKQSDYLILPYNGWQDNYPHALQIIDRLKPKHVLLDHYDVTFPPISPYVNIQPIIDHDPRHITALRHDMPLYLVKP